MVEPERWKTTRRCPKCLHKQNGDTNYLWATTWGRTEEGKPLIKLDCVDGKCGFTDLTSWDGGK